MKHQSTNDGGRPLTKLSLLWQILNLVHDKTEDDSVCSVAKLQADNSVVTHLSERARHRLRSD